MSTSAQLWYFSVRHDAAGDVVRRAVVGLARASTVEAALHLAGVPEVMRAEIRANQTVRDFVDGKLDPELTGYYVPSPVWKRAATAWVVTIGPVQEVLL